VSRGAANYGVDCQKRRGALRAPVHPPHDIPGIDRFVRRTGARTAPLQIFFVPFVSLW
jgi:hypothetical protein